MARRQSTKSRREEGASSPARDHDLVKVYLNQMSHIPPISVEEERILAKELEDSRAELRMMILNGGHALIHALQMLHKIVAGQFPVDRVLLIEANDKKKKELIRRELDGTRRSLRRLMAEHRRIFRDYLDESLDRYERAKLRQALERKVRQGVAVLIPYRMQVSRLGPVHRRMRSYERRMELIEARMAELKERGDDEADRECEALEENRRQLVFQAQGDRHMVRRYLAGIDRAHERYEQAKKNLSKKNLRLVVSIAKKFRNKGLPFLDLIQEGNTGLMKALDRYQASRGNKFSTYATWWIKQTITRAIAYQSRTVRIPIHAINTLNRLIEDREDFIKRMGREPTVEEIAEVAKLPVREVARLLELNRSSLSLDQPYGNGDEGFFGDLIEDERGETPIDASQQIMLRESIADLLKTLSYREREVLKLRYGLGDGYTYTLEEVGAIFKVSRERIRQIEVGALAKLQLPQRKNMLRGFFEETLR